mmetsp:Transcript_55634/g.88662  ORF Transcript_55634/g.88662 Transcript_55634/m.88662 type:complete len:370 (+) Transcript_55634:19-1128(+)
MSTDRAAPASTENISSKRHEQESIVCGFIRESTEHFDDKHIPLDVEYVCMAFYDEHIYWEFDEKQLCKLSEMKSGECITHKPFFRDNIEFELSLHPNQKWDVDSDFDTGYIYLRPSIPDNVESITAFLHFECEQNEAKFKITKTFANRNQDDEDAHIQGISDRVKWIFKLPYKEWRNIFIIHSLEILQIKYKPALHAHAQPTDYNKDIKICKVSQLEWSLDVETLDKMKKALYLQSFISELFDAANQNYCIYIVPQGCMGIEYEQRTLEIIMVLFKLPHRIGAIDYMYTIRNSYNEKEVSGMLRFEGYSEYKYWWFQEDNKFYASYLDQVDSLTFYVTIDIQFVYDEQLEEVPMEQWSEYGVIMNDASE